MIPHGVTLYVIRHGETEHNVERRLTGQHHSPLTPLGLSQARKNGEILARIEPGLARFDFVASPLERACRTLELVREAAGLEPMSYRTDKRVQEIDVGNWFGITMAEAKERVPHEVAAYEADPWNYARGGRESFAGVHGRVKSFLSEITRDSVIVCHFHPARMFYAHAMNASPDEILEHRVPNLGVMRLRAGSHEFFGE